MSEGAKPIGVLCGRANGSPKVLGETLTAFLESEGLEVRLLYRVGAVQRLVSSRYTKTPWFLWWIYRLLFFWSDRRLWKELRDCRCLVICSTSPNAFRRRTFNIESLKRRVGCPVYLYSVQFLNNAPTLMDILRQHDEPLFERFDHHLAVSAVTEVRSPEDPRWSHIGLFLRSTGLCPEPKERFLAVVDFERAGFESYRKSQIAVLEALGIDYVALQGQYSMEAIRDIYRKASIFFIQFPESFGMPIAECLACGAYVATAHPGWPMAWRINQNPEFGKAGELPSCFVVYDGEGDLRAQISHIQKSYDLVETPKKVFATFLKHYPHCYSGRPQGLHRAFETKVRQQDQH